MRVVPRPSGSGAVGSRDLHRSLTVAELHVALSARSVAWRSRNARPVFASTFRDDELGAGGADGVRVRWLGTAGFAIEHQGTTILFDPYLTRASLLTCVTSRLVSDTRLLAAHTPRADAIIVGHTHFDHALDVPAIAALTGARVYGSRSAVKLCRASGLPEARLHDVEGSPGAEAVVAEVGPFELRFHPSAHSRFALGRVPFPGRSPTAIRCRCGSSTTAAGRSSRWRFASRGGPSSTWAAPS